MPDRLTFLLSPYRPPTSYPISLASGEAAAWLNGWAALWHPAVLQQSPRPPQAASSYDHDDPVADAIYAVPTGPTMYQPGDWAERLARVNAVSFSATVDRPETVANLLAAFPAEPVGVDCHRMFVAVGFAYLTIETWYDAASHDHLLDVEAFWADVRTAAANPGDPGHVREHLKLATEKLQHAREVLHAGSLKLLDLVAPDPDKPDAAWPLSLAAGFPLTVIANAETILRLKNESPDRFAELMAKCPPGLPAAVEFAVGSLMDRDDTLLPLESQLWNLTTGREQVAAATGQPAGPYARISAANHLHLPSWLSHANCRHAIVTPVIGDGGANTKSPCLQWPGPDGKTVEAFSKDLLAADDEQTFFNLAHYLHTASGSEATPAMAFLHRSAPAAESHADLIALADLGMALGEWQSVGQYLSDVGSGDYSGVAGADDFAKDLLDDRVSIRKLDRPVSAIAEALRIRRRIDGVSGLAALHRALTPPSPEDEADDRAIESIESSFESVNPDGSFDGEALRVVEARVGERLAHRIVARGEDHRPGYVVLNPCNSTRRVALELPPFPNPVAVEGPIKAAQFDADATRLVVEVPSLGFAWIPRSGPAAAAPKPKLTLAAGGIVRNEFFEAEFDPATGGLRAFRDLRTRAVRFGVVPVFNPGCKTRGTSLTITHSGTALGEIVSAGELVSEMDEPLARFTIRARAWLGRPVLELRVVWELAHAPSGYPWHAYYGLRVGVRDDRIATFKGVNGTSFPTYTSRIVSPDFFEFRFGRERSFVFPGGLGFMNKVGPKVYDLIQIPERETARSFDLLLSLDRDNPMQTAAGWTAPAAVVPVDRGPPPTGASSWLAHVDMPSVIATQLRPAAATTGETTRAIVMRLIETTGYAGRTEVRLARDPARAFAIDARGETLHELPLDNGAISLDYSAGELMRIRAEW